MNMKINPLSNPKKTYNLRDAYQFYLDSGGTLTNKEFRTIWLTFIEVLKEKFFKGYFVNLGHALGIVGIFKFKPKKSRVIDWKATNELKQYLIDNNEPLYNAETGKGKKYFIYHNVNFAYRLYWFKANLKLAALLKFSPVKAMRKEMGRVINNTPNIENKILTKAEGSTSA